MALFVNHILPIRGILRFVAIYYVSTRYAPPHANLVITGSIINGILKNFLLCSISFAIKHLENRRRFSSLNATKRPSFQVHELPCEGFCKKILPFEGIFQNFCFLFLFLILYTPRPFSNKITLAKKNTNLITIIFKQKTNYC